MDTLDLGSKSKLSTRLKSKCGWMIPETDETGFDYIISEVQDLEKIVPVCSQFRTCIQAGGNVGIWPVALAKKFNRVYTFEPDESNYEALVINCRGFANITHKRAAFGDTFKTGSLRVGVPGNMGALQTQEGTDFDIITIDSLEITDCDLLQLDVEGYEYFALQGAKETIRQSNPVICLELNGLTEKYGKADWEVVRLVESFGYAIHSYVHRDVIFKKV